jgi:hypothetical protein
MRWGTVLLRRCSKSWSNLRENISAITNKMRLESVLVDLSSLMTLAETVPNNWFCFQEFGPKWTNAPCEMDGVWIGNTFSLYYCPILNHCGWQALTNHIIYLPSRNRSPFLLTYLCRILLGTGTVPIRRWNKSWCN